MLIWDVADGGLSRDRQFVLLACGPLLPALLVLSSINILFLEMGKFHFFQMSQFSEPPIK